MPSVETPLHPVSLETARELCRSTWGVEGELTRLASERDQIFRLDARDGRRFVLKLTDPREAQIDTDFQTAALLHIATRDPGLPIPRLCPDLKGRFAIRPDGDGGPGNTARLLTWLEGVLVAETLSSPAQAADLGSNLARLGLALSDFDHPGADRSLHWDLRHTAELRPRLSAIADPDRRRLAEAALNRFEDSTLKALARTRRQVIHADLTPYNALVDRDAPDRVTGIIDFGDLVRTSLVCDPAIAAAYLMGDGEEAMNLPRSLVAAYHAVRPLSVEEIRLIAPLIEARHAMTVAITEHHASLRPDNRAYITKNTATAWHGLAVLASRPLDSWSDDFS